MSRDRLFLDTVFIQAILNENDQHHHLAMKLLPRVENAYQVYVTEAIFLEVGNGLSSFDHQKVAKYIEQCYQGNNNIEIVSVDTILLNKGLKRYKSYSDKLWGLVDCLSFVVMEEKGLTEALTSDKHFLQAGFRALLLEIN